MIMSQSASTSLKERIGVDPIRPRVIAECVTLIDAQVKAKGGFSGIAIKAAYGTIKTIKRGFVKGVVDALLDDWLEQLQPHFERWSAAKTGTFSEYITSRSDDVAEALLSVTDGRAEKTTHTTAKKTYIKMRPSAKKNVIDAIPDLGKLIERHMDPAQSAEVDVAAAAAVE
jgi:hypothetical protein